MKKYLFLILLAVNLVGCITVTCPTPPLVIDPTAGPTATIVPTATSEPTILPTVAPTAEPTRHLDTKGGLVCEHYLMHDTKNARSFATPLLYMSEVQANWQIVDQFLSKHPDSPLQVYFHTSEEYNGAYFRCWIPDQYVYVLEKDGKKARIPRYDSDDFLAYTVDFIKEFGRRYNGHPVIITVGLDGETQPAKTIGGVDWEAAMYGTDINAIPRWFVTKWLPGVLRAYRAAFPDSELYVNCAPGGTTTRAAVLKLCLELNIGMKHSGLVEDTDNQYGYDANGNPPTLQGILDGTYTGYIGSWDIVELSGLPLITESAYSWASDPFRALCAGLSRHPRAMVWHKEWFTLLTADQFAWAKSYLGVTKENTPGVWWLQHNTIYPKTKSGSKGYWSGHVGDYAFWLTRNGDTWQSEVPLPNPKLKAEFTGTFTLTYNGQSVTLQKEMQLQGIVMKMEITGSGNITFLGLTKSTTSR